MNRNSWEGVLPDGTMGWIWETGSIFVLTGGLSALWRMVWKELRNSSTFAP